MEGKQLNFNRPLLSVRRFSGTTVSPEADDKKNTAKSVPKRPPRPAYKSELKSGPVRDPGSVPFVWEQIPGRPKDESRSKYQAPEGTLVAPRLPPGRISKPKKQGSDKGSKSSIAAQSAAGNELSLSQNDSMLERKTTSENESSNEKMNSRPGSEDGEEIYLDAHDLLSRCESAYMNCSVSGLSGLDGSDIISSGTFSTDPQTRDFMMGRFLPAAKAMASETPQYAPRKQPVREQPISREEQRREREVVTWDKRHQLDQCRQNVSPCYVQDIVGELSEDEEMIVLLKVSIPSAGGGHSKSINAGSYTEAKKRHAGTDGYKQRLISDDQVAGLSSGGISPYRNECSHSILHDGKRFLGIPEKTKSLKETRSSDKYMKGRKFLEILASDHTESEVGLGSPVEKTLYIDSVQTVKSSVTNSFSSDIKGDIKALERCSEIEETPASESSIQDIKHLGDMNKKAVVYFKCLDSSDSRFLSSFGKSTNDLQTDADGVQDQEDSNKLAISKVANKEKFNLESQKLETSGGQCHSLTQKCPKLTNIKLPDEESTVLKTQEPTTSGTDYISHGLDRTTLISSKVARKGKIDLESHRGPVKLGDQENTEGNNPPPPLGPPLPKSPSESWLRRTLPTISSRSSPSSRGSWIYTSSTVSKTSSSVDPKWEMIVKTSNAHHGRLRFSEEFLTPKPEA